MDNSPKIEKIIGVLIGSLLAFLIIRVGLGYGFGFMENSTCLKYLGCVNGFFGFDVLVHFTTSFFDVIFIVWLVNKFPKLNILHDEFWKNVIILIAFAALVGVVWEFWEFGVDHFRMMVLHQNLVYPRNLLMQTNNSDTMGDLIFGLLGACSAIFTLKNFLPDAFKRSE